MSHPFQTVIFQVENILTLLKDFFLKKKILKIWYFSDLIQMG